MPERDRGTEPSPWADPAEMKEPEPDWAKEIRARRKARAERLRKVFDGFDGQPLKRPPPPKPKPPAGDARMSHVFPRVFNRTLPTAVSAEGAWIVDADGKRYLDGAGGAIVVGVGHGDRSLIDAATAQLDTTQYVHGTMFTTEALERYADELAPHLPMDDPRIYPVSGGSEAVETAHQDGARVPPGARRRRPHDDHRPPELVPRQHARRAGREREGAHPQALHRRGSAGSSTRPPPTSTGAATRSIPTDAASGTAPSSNG